MIDRLKINRLNDRQHHYFPVPQSSRSRDSDNLLDDGLDVLIVNPNGYFNLGNHKQCTADCVAAVKLQPKNKAARKLYKKALAAQKKAKGTFRLQNFSPTFLPSPRCACKEHREWEKNV